MESSLWTILPNLSIGVIAVVALAYTTLKSRESNERQQTEFLNALDSRSERHEIAMKEREDHLRKVEFEVRNNILNQLSQNNQLMAETAKTLERVMTHLDKIK